MLRTRHPVLAPALVAASLLCATLLASCSPHRVARTDALPTSLVVTVTGFDRTTVEGGSTGPVTVTLTGVQKRRLAGLLDGLAAAPGGACMEDAALFSIAASQIAGGPTTWSATADVCPGTLTIHGPRGARSRTDRSCSLVRFIDSLFPAHEAGGTRGYAFVCDQ